MVRKKMVAVVFAAGLGLAACSRSEPEQPATTNDMVEAPPTDEATPEVLPSDLPSATPTAVTTNDTASVDVPPEAPVPPDAQVLEDADATGMTARVSRDAPPAGNDQPVQ